MQSGLPQQPQQQPPAQPVVRRFYAISDIKKQNALQLLFPSVQLDEQDGEIGFVATLAQAQLFHGAIDAYLAQKESLESKIAKAQSVVAPSQDWLPRPVTGLLYGLAAGVLVSAAASPLIYTTGHTMPDVRADDIRNYQLLAFFLSTFVGGVSGMFVGVYQVFKDKLKLI